MAARSLASRLRQRRGVVERENLLVMAVGYAGEDGPPFCPGYHPGSHRGAEDGTGRGGAYGGLRPRIYPPRL